MYSFSLYIHIYVIEVIVSESELKDETKTNNWT